MTRWQHFLVAIGWRKAPARAGASEAVAELEPLSELELDRAVSVPATHPTYRAFMQLLEQTKKEAEFEVTNDMPGNPTSMALHAGGARYLRAVRNNVLERRKRVAKKAAIG